MIQLACVLSGSKEQRLAQWFAARTADGRASTRKTMIVALARSCSSPSGVSLRGARFPQGIVPTAGVMSNSMEREQRQEQTAWQPVLESADESEVAVSRLKTMASNAAVQIGPAARSFADDAYDCIMVRSTHGSTEYKVVA